MKKKISELTGAALDYAVAECEKLDRYTDLQGRGWATYVNFNEQYTHVHYTPSTSWGWAGPIIERELIELAYDASENEVWQAHNGIDVSERGSTPLIAAMRCYVAMKAWQDQMDEVRIPQELLKEPA